MSESIGTKARRFVKAKEKRDKLKLELESVEKEFRDLEADLWQAIEASEQKSGTWDLGPGYGTVQLTRRETTTATVLSPEEAAEALEKMGLAEAVLGSPAVRKKVLNEYVRDWLKSGQPLPKGIDFHKRRYLTTTKKKGG